MPKALKAFASWRWHRPTATRTPRPLCFVATHDVVVVCAFQPTCHQVASALLRRGETMSRLVAVKKMRAKLFYTSIRSPFV